MCYWRRLSKRSVDEFDYEYTTNSSALVANKSADNNEPVISDSLNLFKALQVRQESDPARAKQQQMREVYAIDDEASLVCYRHAEVFVFFSTMGLLFLLLISVAITCCLRIQKLTKRQLDYSRLIPAATLSPSLLSISDAISNAGSIISSATNGASLLTTMKAHKTCPNWYFQQQQQQLQKHSASPTSQLSRSLDLHHNSKRSHPSVSSFQQHTRPFEYPSQHGRWIATAR